MIAVIIIRILFSSLFDLYCIPDKFDLDIDHDDILLFDTDIDHWQHETLTAIFSSASRAVSLLKTNRFIFLLAF